MIPMPKFRNLSNNKNPKEFFEISYWKIFWKNWPYCITDWYRNCSIVYHKCWIVCRLCIPQFWYSIPQMNVGSGCLLMPKITLDAAGCLGCLSMPPMTLDAAEMSWISIDAQVDPQDSWMSWMSIDAQDDPWCRWMSWMSTNVHDAQGCKPMLKLTLGAAGCLGCLLLHKLCLNAQKD